MINYLPYIFGVTSFFGGLFMFLYSFRLYKPKFKNEYAKKRHEESLKKFGTLMKVCSIILILNGSYDLIKRDSDRYKIGSRNLEWTQKDRDALIESCMRDVGATAINYPQITKEYCTCFVEKIMEGTTKSQYEKILTKSQEEQTNEILPIIQDCINELKQSIDILNR